MRRSQRFSRGSRRSRRSTPDAIVARARGLEVPALRTFEHTWFDAGPPETVAHEFVFRLMTPHDALKVALEAEQRARGYFEQVFANATDPDVKMLAAAMIQEEQQHIEWVERALATDPDPHLDWDKLFAHRRTVLPPGPGVEIPVRSVRSQAGKKAAKKAPVKKKAAARRPVPKPKAAAKKTRKLATQRKAAAKKTRKSGPKRRPAAKKARKPAAKKKGSRRR